MEPPFRESAMAPFEGAMVVSYRLSIVTVALSVTIWPHCDRMFPTLKSTGGGHFGPKFRGVPLGVDPLMLRIGVCRERTLHAN